MAQYFLEIIKLIFPYHLMLAPFPDWITPWFVFGIIVYFFLSLSLFLYKTVPFIRRVSKNNKDFSFAFLQSDPTLGTLWEPYKKTLITIHTNFGAENCAEKTEADAEDYFSESVVLPQLLNLRYWTAVPGILLALGILGTFLGLTLGIQNFDTSSSENIQKSIETLLAGMSTAFLTSLWGMVLSLVFNGLEKYLLKKVSNSLNVLCTDLNSKYTITPQERADLEERRLRNILKKYLETELEKDQFTNVANMLKQIMRSSEEQENALKSFSTDLADGIQISSLTINTLGDKIAEALNARFSETLVPSIDQLNSFVGVLQETHKQSSGEFLEATVARLEESVTRMLDELNKNVFGSSKLEMEALAQVTAEAGKIIQSVPESITNALAGMAEGTNKLKSLVTSTTDDLQSSMLNTTKQIQSQAEESTAAMVGEVQRLCNSVAEVVQANKEAGDFNALLLEEFKTTLGKLQDGTSSLETTLKIIIDVSQKINDAALELSVSETSLSEACYTLSNYTSTLRENLNQYSKAHERNLHGLENLLKESNDSLNLHVSQFQIIQEGLAGVFSEIQQGLHGYEKTVATSINGFLQQLTQEAGSAIQHLSGAIDELKETVEDWEDSFNKGGQH